MDRQAIARAAAALRKGDLVVFPTETVYGVGANALDPAAVRQVFAAKGRPADNPLIVHVANAAAARALAGEWSPAADRLAAAFWPGPLTLVVPRGPAVPDEVTAGLDSVALRVPRHPIAQALLAESRLPLAAPSANVSGRPSPTRVEDARADLGAKVAVYLDGGPCDVGLESTVVDVRKVPTLLRPGAIVRAQLERLVGRLAQPGSGPARSPGMRHRHYAPRARLHVVSPEGLAAQAELLRKSGRKVAIIASAEFAPDDPQVRVPGRRDDLAAWARRLFALLRDLDREGFEDIVVEEPPPQGLGEALRDRLRAASRPAPAS